MPIALGLALLVQEARRWNNILRTAILIPSALGIASASVLFYALYSPQVGPINQALADEPSLANSDPMGAGWFFKVKLAKADEVAALMDEAAYKAFAA